MRMIQNHRPGPGAVKPSGAGVVVGSVTLLLTFDPSGRSSVSEQREQAGLDLHTLPVVLEHVLKATTE